MKIVLLGAAHPYRGGIAHFTGTLHRKLGARGHDVRVLTFTRQYPSFLFPGASQMEEDAAPDPPPAERVLDTLNPVSWWRTARRIVAMNPDLLVVRYWMPFFAPSFGIVARFARRRGVRVAALVDNVVPHEARPGDRALTRFFLGQADAFIVLSEAVERDLLALRPGARVVRVSHPVYDLFGESLPRGEARRRLGLDPEGNVLLFFGAIRRYKGLETLLDALPLVLREVPVTLLVAGDFYGDEDRIRRKIEGLGIGGAVRLSGGYVATAEVPAYFSAANVVVQPYVSATQSGVAQVAYNFGRPLIVTKVGGLAEVVPDGIAGLVVPPEDPAALAGTIVRFFRERLEGRLTEGVLRERERFSWEPLCAAVEALASPR
jgi:glycosyltransferase involved in cell wall biosynthesis